MVAEPLNREFKRSFVRIDRNGVAPSAGFVLADFSRVSSLVNSVGFFLTSIPATDLTSNNSGSFYRADDGLRDTGSSSAKNLTEERNNHLTPEVTEKSKDDSVSGSKGFDNQNVKASSAASKKRSRPAETDEGREDDPLLKENENILGAKRRKTNDPVPQVKKEEGDCDSRTVDAKSKTNVIGTEVQGLQCHVPLVLVPGNKTVTMPISTGVAQIFFVQARAGPSNVVGDTTLTMKSPADHSLQQEIESLRKDQVILKQRISRFQEVFKSKVLLEAVLKKLSSEKMLCS